MRQQAPPAERAVKLSEVLNRSCQQTCDGLTAIDMMTCLAVYEKSFGFGKRPAKSETPTVQQLSAISFLLKTGVNPYCDFGVYGPNGLRIMKKVHLQGQYVDANNNLQQLVVNGPPNINIWMGSFDVMMTPYIMLNAVDVGNLFEYNKNILEAYNHGGDQSWALLYQAHMRTREEYFDQIRLEGFMDLEKKKRQAQALGKVYELQYGDYDETRFLNYCFAQVANRSDWWWDEYYHPVLKLSTRQTNWNSVIRGDVRIQKGLQYCSVPNLRSQWLFYSGAPGGRGADKRPGGELPRPPNKGPRKD